MASKLKLGKLKKIDLRSCWPNEEYDFSDWLASPENMDMLAEAIDFEYDTDSIEKEKGVGKYSADIVLKESYTNKTILIENQYGKTDHRHLGEIITYASGLSESEQAGVSRVIWITEDANDEHIAAFRWLNNISKGNTAFYLVKLELLTIDAEDTVAPRFEVLEEPNEFVKEIDAKSGKVEQTERLSKMIQFWNFLNLSQQESLKKNFNKRKAWANNWYPFSIGSSECHLCAVLLSIDKQIRFELYVHRSKDVYDALFSKKNDIEKSLGLKLNWQRLDEKKASRISVILKTSLDLDKQDNWSINCQEIMNMAIKFKDTFKKLVRDL